MIIIRRYQKVDRVTRFEMLMQVDSALVVCDSRLYPFEPLNSDGVDLYVLHGRVN